MPSIVHGKIIKTINKIRLATKLSHESTIMLYDSCGITHIIVMRFFRRIK
jgi:hypothetical protein